MLEIVLCSLVTILPDYLFRRYVQGKRVGKEITIYSVWYELRYGLTGCMMLTVLLITIIFYYHPSTTSVTASFRSIPILPETNGRVSEIFVNLSDTVKQGQPIFKLDSSTQEAAVEVARRRIAEVEASILVSRADLAAAEAQIQQAKSSEQQALDELRTKQELARRNPGIVATRDIEQLQVLADGRRAQVTAAEAALEQAENDLRKTTVYAGVSGHIEQFALRVGDIVNPLMRPAGVLIPAGGGRQALLAGFGQIESQVIKVGLAAEATCMSKPLTIIPMVVTDVQDFIAAGQVRAGEQLIDVQSVRQPGTILVYLAPLFKGALDGVTPGSSCIANVYTSNHERLAKGDVGVLHGFFLHAVDAVALVHALILRAQALLLPVRVLVLGGH